jgi:hypothetical protein
LRRGNATQHSVFTGALGEITFNTSNNTIHGHDGNTIGGFEIALKSDLANVTVGNISITANVDLSSNTTDDLPEGVANLYFTNTRVRTALSAGTGLDYDEANGIFTANVDLSDYALINSLSNVAFTGEYSDLANTPTIPSTTTDIAEGANLYFTNTRAIGAFTGGSGVTIEANGLLISTAVANTGGTVTNIEIIAGALIDVIGGPIVSSGNVTVNVDLSELSLITNPSLADQMVVLDSETAAQYKIAKSSLPLSQFNVDLTSTNIAEGSNLYFTNARAVGSFTAGNNISIASNGLVNVSIPTVPVTSVNGEIGDVVLSTSNIAEGSNFYFTNARAVAAVTGQNVSLFNNDAGYLTSVDLTTSNVVEGSNLYFTNIRAIGSLTSGDGIVIEANGLVISTAASAVESINGEIGNVVLSTANITENGNLYFTNTRAIGALTAGNGVVIESNGLIISPSESIYNGTTSVNIPLSNGAIVFNVDGTIDVADVNVWGLNVNSNLNVTGDIFGNLYSLANHTTSNLAEGTNLYFTNARALAAIVDNIDTSNVTEGANLYFTNARALAAIVDNIDTSNVTEGSNLYYTDARVLDVLSSVDGNVIPNGDTYDLGSTGNVWNNAYIGNVVLTGSITTEATGVPTVESETTLRLTANDSVVVTSSPFQLASFTWAEIQNIVAANGMMVYNTTNTKIQGYVNGSWVDLH